MNRSAIRSALEATVVIAMCAAIGGSLGPQLLQLGGVSPYLTANTETERFEAALRVVAESAAEPVDVEDAVYDGAIPGMLGLLDPHSQFFDPDDFERLREEQRGSYAGVGMQIRSFRGHTIVDFPFPNTPAFDAGLRPGDSIDRIDGVPTSGYTVEQVADSVRGRVGTTVQLSVSREESEQQLDVEVRRARIDRPTVPLAFALQPGLGYVKITSFGETTANEIDDALSALEAGGLSGLVLDLRDNNGGLLNAGVHVAGRFLDRGAVVVAHRGRNSAERLYRSKSGRSGSKYPMTVLVNCRSASAAEIVAGALQDHDRALIVGENTFGKGLVQSVFQSPRSTGVVLTTARYYTPSGRLIQRPYDSGDLAQYYAGPCSDDFAPEPNEVKLTDAGRPVYGGAGITPDVRLPDEQYDDFQSFLINARAVERFASRIADEVTEGWEPDDSVYERFQQFVQNERLTVEADAFARHHGFIRRMLMTASYTAAFNVDEGARVERADGSGRPPSRGADLRGGEAAGRPRGRAVSGGGPARRRNRAALKHRQQARQRLGGGAHQNPQHVQHVELCPAVGDEEGGATDSSQGCALASRWTSAATSEATRGMSWKERRSARPTSFGSSA